MLLVIILVLGAAWSFFIAARPEVGFFLEEGWKFRDAEPSDLYLGVTRFGAAVTGIALLVFAAIFAFSGPEGGESASKKISDPDGRSASPIAVTASPRDITAEAARHAKEECKRLKPVFEEEAEWDAQGRLTNREAITSLAAYEMAELVIEPGADGELVSVRSTDATHGTSGRTLLTLTSSGATCTP